MARFLADYGQALQLAGFILWMLSLFAVLGMRKFRRKIVWSLVCLAYGWLYAGPDALVTYGLGDTWLYPTLPLPLGSIFVLAAALFGPGAADEGAPAAVSAHQPSTDTPSD